MALPSPARFPSYASPALPSAGAGVTPDSAPSGVNKGGRPKKQLSEGLGYGPGVRMAEAMPAGARKKRKQNEKQQIMKQVASFIPESALYMKLLDMERRMDATLDRKKLDIQETLNQPDKVTGTLRMYIFNTHANQAQSEASEPPAANAPPFWTLYLCGRLLDHPLADNLDPNDPVTGSPVQFTQFLKSVHIQLDPHQYPGSYGDVLWDSEKSEASSDGFEIKRCGTSDVNLKVTLAVASGAERFQLSDELAALLGVKVDTRAKIIAALWSYIKVHKLQSNGDPGIVDCNAPLAAVLGEKRFKVTTLAAKVMLHLRDPDPIVLDYTLRVTGRPEVACFDIQVDVPRVGADRAYLGDLFARIQNKGEEVARHNRNISSAINKINDAKRRRMFFLGFSHSPVDFINGLVASQSRDLRTMAAGDAQDFEYERRSDFYKKPWVEDAVMRYMHRQHAAGQS